jgi:UDP-N-acetylenolpyruvoylglucosamine reductase
LPDPGKIPNVGSFFKNPVIPADQFKLLKQRFPGLVSYPADEHQVKLAAGWLIDYRAHIEVHPAGTPDDRLPAGRLVDRPHTRVTITWP